MAQSMCPGLYTADCTSLGGYNAAEAVLGLIHEPVRQQTVCKVLLFPRGRCHSVYSGTQVYTHCWIRGLSANADWHACLATEDRQEDPLLEVLRTLTKSTRPRTWKDVSTSGRIALNGLSIELKPGNVSL